MNAHFKSCFSLPPHPPASGVAFVMRRQLFDGLRPGDHLCAIHESDEERLQSLGAFFRCSIDAGARCIYFHGQPSDEDAIAAFRDYGFDPTSHCNDGRLKTIPTNGSFDSSLLQSVLRESTAGDGHSIRVAIEIPAGHGERPDAASLIEHAACINDIVADAGIVCLCLCDRHAFSPASLVALIDSHPLVSLGTQVFHNCRFSRDARLGTGDGGEAELQARLDGLRRDHERESDLGFAMEEFRAIAEATSDCILVWDREGNYLYANQAAIDHVGTTRDNVIGRNMRDGLGHVPEFMRIWLERIETVFGNGEEMIVRDEFSLDGRTVHSESKLTPIRDASGEVRAVGVLYRDISERKRIERDLIESEHRFRSFVENANDIVYSLSPDGVFTYVSPNWLDFIGEPAEAALGESFEKYVHPEDIPLCREFLDSVLSSGDKKNSVEYRVRHRNGSWRWHTSNGAPLRDRDGGVTAYVGIARDVTERRNMENLLRAERDVAFALARADSLDEALCVCVDAVLRVSEVDSGGIYLLDEDSGDLTLACSRGVSDAFRERASRFRRDSDQCRAVLTGNPLHATYADLDMTTEGGRCEGLRATSIVPVFHREKVIGCLNAASHTSESLPKHARHAIEAFALHIGGALGRLRDEQSIRESEERFRGVFETSPVGIAVIDPETQGFLRANRSFLDIIGYSDSELPGLTVRDITHPEDWASEFNLIESRLRGDSPDFEVEKRYVRKDGDTRWVHVTGDVLRVGGGKPLAVANVEDVTERRQMEERLRQMEKMDAIGRLAGGVAHDFNNQLAGIMGYADMLRGRLDKPELQRFAENVLVGARRAGDLTKKLLAFARKGQYESVPVDLHEIIHEVVEILNHSIDKKIEVKQHLTANPSTTRGDPTQIQNAFLNLAINAGDAMPEGGEIVFETAVAHLDEDYCASLPYEIAPGPYLRVSVTDTGCGIPKENLDRVFEPFFTTKEVGKGTGMGLAAVYGTVKQHGGAINVYSETGHGTTFKVYLPVEERAAQRIRRTTDSIPAPRAASILVVDDEELIRNLAEDMLTSLGYSVKTKKHGESGVSYYEKHWQEIDLVILDMVMPKMNGPEAYRAMKAINPDVKVLLASGYSINGAAQGLLAEGVQGFIQKPFERTEFSTKVAEAIQDEPE